MPNLKQVGALEAQRKASMHGGSRGKLVMDWKRSISLRTEKCSFAKGRKKYLTVDILLNHAYWARYYTLSGMQF
jgi:hypothetical protein